MDDVSIAGAEAAAAYFLDLYRYANVTGDLAQWRAMSHPECIFCASVISGIEEQVAAGRTYEGSAVEVLSASAREISVGYWFGVNVDFIEGPSAIYDSSGAVVSERAHSNEISAEFAMIAEQGTWVVREFEVLEDVRVDGP